MTKFDWQMGRTVTPSYPVACRSWKDSQVVEDAGGSTVASFPNVYLVVSLSAAHF